MTGAQSSGARRVTARATGGAVGAGLLVVAALVVGGVVVSGPGSRVTVPDASLRYPAEAVAVLRAAGLTPTFPDVPAIRGADTGMNGYAVESQSPAPGTRVPPGSVVSLRLLQSANGGAPRPEKRPAVTVPDVVGQEPNEALPALAALGLLVDIPAVGSRDALVVTGQSLKAGSSVPQGTRIVLNL